MISLYTRTNNGAGSHDSSIKIETSANLLFNHFIFNFNNAKLSGGVIYINLIPLPHAVSTNNTFSENTTTNSL